MKNDKLGLLIELAFLLTGLAVMWQAYRFCTGDLSFPGFVKPQAADLMSFIQLAAYYFIGMAGFLAAGLWVMWIGRKVSRWTTGESTQA